MNPSIVLAVATLVFLLVIVRVGWSLRDGAGANKASSPSLLLMLLGFALQCGFLYLRGQEVGRCPLTSFPDVLCFISWSMVLIYLLIGPAYHISLLGLFTSPLVFLMQGAAFLMGLPLVEKVARADIDYWTEMHASVALLSYGAFALAFVAGLMFLLQDRLLKSHRLETLFYRLPPIHSLGLVVFRLMGLGLILLSLGILSALKMQQMPSAAKLAIIIAVWIAYAVPVFLHLARNISYKRSAWAAVIAFIFPLISLWLLNAN